MARESNVSICSWLFNCKSKKVDLNLDLSWYKRRDIHNGFELKKVFDIFNRVDFLNKPLHSNNFLAKLILDTKTMMSLIFTTHLKY